VEARACDRRPERRCADEPEPASLGTLLAEGGTAVDIALVGLVASVVVAAVLLARLRTRSRPDDYKPGDGLPGGRGRRQRIMAKLEPMPQIPTVMDLVRMEVEETGVENIPGHEGLGGPVMLRVFRRDEAVRTRCPHGGYAFVIRSGVKPEDALEDDVRLFCAQCGEVDDDTGVPGTSDLDTGEPEEPGTDSEQ
jgi:hypothetical protein